MAWDAWRREDGRWTLTFVRRSPHPVEKVWRAITEPEHLAVWFPTTIDGERSAGSPLSFSFPMPEAPPMEGEVLAFDPFDKLSRETWVRNNEAKKREQVLSRMLKRVAADKDMPPEDAPEYEKFRTKDQAGFDALKDWLEAELKNAKGS